MTERLGRRRRRHFTTRMHASRASVENGGVYSFGVRSRLSRRSCIRRFNTGVMVKATSRSSFHRGQGTLEVSHELHVENRARLIEAMRAAGHTDGLIALKGGAQLTRYSTDNEPLFRQESYFHWAFGVLEGDCAGVVDIATGDSILFVPRLPEEYAIWMGAIEGLDSFSSRYLTTRAKYCDEFDNFLKSSGKKVFTLRGKNSDSGSMTSGLGEDVEKALGDAADVSDALFNVITELRTVKTAREQEVLEYASKMSSIAHVEVIKSIKPGMMEYQLESLFKHVCYSQGGMRNESYTGICAAGKNGATLHYGHAGAPNASQIEAGDLVLMDMGAEYHCYCADITTTVPASGKFTEDQKIIYEGVLSAHQAVLKALRPGCAWNDLQRMAEMHILDALVKGGFLVGDIDEMMSKRVSATFMPHGLGHLLGIDTHDVGGYGLPGIPERSSEAGLKNCRTARIMKEGFAMTIEPGCYFIDCLLDRALAEDSDIKQYFVVDRVNSCRAMGGVRLEDNVIITSDGCKSWTNVPRTVAEVEAVMAGASWP